MNNNRINRKKVKIEVIGEERVIEVEEGTLLSQALIREGLISLPCGGRGLCGQCAVKVYGEVTKPSGNEVARGFSGPVRLACQTRVLGNLKVEILVKPTTPAPLKAM